MAEHDQSYKLLFSHREMVADLVRGFVREDWVSRLDFDTLERVREIGVSHDLRKREDDIICPCAGASAGSMCICCWSSNPPSTA
jgi:hypothetical protein